MSKLKHIGRKRKTKCGATITETGIDVAGLRLGYLRNEWPHACWQSEFEFATGRKWRFDYASAVYRVAIEIEGGVYRRGKQCPACGQRAVGAHSSVSGQLRDIEKYNTATATGWRVLRFTPDKFANFGNVVALVDPCIGGQS